MTMLELSMYLVHEFLLVLLYRFKYEDCTHSLLDLLLDVSCFLLLFGDSVGFLNVVTIII